MERGYEDHYHRVEARHWWFRARREMVLRLVEGLAPAKNSRILDIGCSSGLLLHGLAARGYRSVQGIDSSRPGVTLCQQAGLCAHIMDAHRPDLPDHTLDGITASDVLEHLEHDAAALAAWRRLLKPGGWLIVFVPAFMWLWTGHDDVNRHFRRYTRPQLVRRLHEAGFVVERSSYWNTALFVPVALVRLWRRWTATAAAPGSEASDMFLPPAILNGGLRAWMRLENRLHGWGINSPVGISVMIVARRPADWEAGSEMQPG